MKRFTIWSLICCCLILSGCAKTDEFLKDYAHNNSGIVQDTEYQEYEKHTDEIDTAGYYINPEEEYSESADEIPEGIHITFASNSYISVTYKLNGVEVLDKDFCYVKPGNFISATVSNARNDKSNMYDFDAFRVVDFSKDNRGTSELQFNQVEGEWRLIIPDDFEGDELSILPTGRSQNRSIELLDYCQTEKGKIEVDGTWKVNEKETKKDVIEINPFESYCVTYLYDDSKYYFSDSTPKAYSYNDYEGAVYFSQCDSMSDTNHFSVTLKEYISATITSSDKKEKDLKKIITSVKVNGEKIEGLALPKLKEGDIVVVETNASAEINCEPLKRSGKVEGIDGTKGCRFSFGTSENTSGGFEFDPTKYSFEHGKVRFYDSYNHEITSVTPLQDGDIIRYEGEPEEGYVLPKGEHEIQVAGINTANDIRKIEFYSKLDVTVTLPQPMYGGKIIYQVDGKEISNNSVVPAGTVITLAFESWNGWTYKSNVNKEYLVNDSNEYQTVRPNQLDNIFYESDDHKPTLKVLIDESVGENIKFSLNAAGDVSAEGIRYRKSNGFKENANEVIKKSYAIDSKIGTERGIFISGEGAALERGSAIRFDIETEDSIGKKENAIRYVLVTPFEEIIDIYKAEEIAKSNKSYKSITLKISKVSIEYFSARTISNANIFISTADVTNPVQLKDGDAVEASRKIKVRIVPVYGYYLTGNKVSDADDSYEDTMKYSDYISDYSDIVRKHSIKKIYTVFLDVSDEYGTVEYKLDKKIVSGQQRIREEQKLTISFTITDDSYVIKRDDSGFWGWTTKLESKTEESIEIPINSDIDGKTISRKDWIQIEKKGK